MDENCLLILISKDCLRAAFAAALDTEQNSRNAAWRMCNKNGSGLISRGLFFVALLFFKFFKRNNDLISHSFTGNRWSCLLDSLYPSNLISQLFNNSLRCSFFSLHFPAESFRTEMFQEIKQNPSRCVMKVSKKLRCLFSSRLRQNSFEDFWWTFRSCIRLNDRLHFLCGSKREMRHFYT